MQSQPSELNEQEAFVTSFFLSPVMGIVQRLGSVCSVWLLLHNRPTKWGSNNTCLPIARRAWGDWTQLTNSHSASLMGSQSDGRLAHLQGFWPKRIPPADLPGLLSTQQPGVGGLPLTKEHTPVPAPMSPPCSTVSPKDPRATAQREASQSHTASQLSLRSQAASLPLTPAGSQSPRRGCSREDGVRLHSAGRASHASGRDGET